MRNLLAILLLLVFVSPVLATELPTTTAKLPDGTAITIPNPYVADPGLAYSSALALNNGQIDIVDKSAERPDNIVVGRVDTYGALNADANAFWIILLLFAKGNDAPAQVV
ncbi:MAG: hypothetical protein AAB897_00675 [Patescibacteria group bacterium]